MKKEGVTTENSFGVAGVVLGIVSIVLSLFSSPVAGIALGIVGLVFSYKQKQHGANAWSRAARTLNIVGIVVGVIVFIAFFVLSSYLAQNSDLLQQLAGVS